MLRVDSTVTDAPVHPPTDSSLLWDSVRMMVRLLGEADDLLAGLGWRNHSRRAKKRSRVDPVLPLCPTNAKGCTGICSR